MAPRGLQTRCPPATQDWSRVRIRLLPTIITAKTTRLREGCCKKMARILTFLAVAAILLAVLSGCGGGEKQRAQETAAGIPEKDRDYVVNLGYYNCDHMTAACIAKDTGIFDELGLKV
jgi:hypothetical protein